MCFNCCLPPLPQCLRRGKLRHPLTTQPLTTGFGRFNSHPSFEESSGPRPKRGAWRERLFEFGVVWKPVPISISECSRDFAGIGFSNSESHVDLGVQALHTTIAYPGRNRFGSIRFGSVTFEKSSVRFGSVRKHVFPGSMRFGLPFSDASWLGPVRFGLFPHPVPELNGSVRFGSVLIPSCYMSLFSLI